MSYPRLALDEDATDACVPEEIEAQLVYPGVLILLDRSRSMMYPDCLAPAWDYWTPATEGIIGIVGSLEQSVAFGLGLFPDPEMDGEDINCYGMSSTSNPVRLNNASAIAAAFEAAPCPHGGTPTAPSLDGSLAALGRYVSLRTASILLVTDGAPNCNFDLDHTSCTCTNPEGDCFEPFQCLDDVRTYAELDELRLGHGVETHVLGLVGATGRDWAGVMHAMAEHGGTGEAVLVEDPDDVGPVIEELTRQIIPCLFDVDPDELGDPDSLLFDVGGVEWPRDASRLSGWDLVEPDRVRFFGPPCDDILASGIRTVHGQIPCEE